MSIKVFELKDHVRIRPQMYIGKNGISLMKGLIVDASKRLKNHSIDFLVAINGNNDFVFKIKSDLSCSNFIELFDSDFKNHDYIFPKVLKAISGNFKIIEISDKEYEVHFSIDKAVKFNMIDDYFQLAQEMLQLSLIFRKHSIITKDRRPSIEQQNFFSFPEGIFYLFSQEIENAPGQHQFILKIDEEINGRQYQIGLAYRSDWKPRPFVLSFANEVHTTCGGSLVNGVIDGLQSGLRKYIKIEEMQSHIVRRKKLNNGLILICAVQGNEFEYGGSWKETLENDSVQKEAEKLVTTKLLDLFSSNEAIADSFVSRFDTTNIFNKMF
ncbi:hypothetical protein GC194_02580 [bacterium]|nr:hypothetical protein [bacterium]